MAGKPHQTSDKPFWTEAFRVRASETSRQRWSLMPRRRRPDYWDDALVHLSRRDRHLKRIIAAYPGICIESRGAPFYTLVRSIVGQQISTRAADAVWQRVAEALSDVTPQVVLSTPWQTLRACGLTDRKTDYFINCAEHFADKRVNPRRWPRMDDDAVIAELVRIKGIGQWTAQMVLIFNLLRPNVLPLDDLGLLKALSVHHAGGEPVDKRRAAELAEPWAPYRSVATWYLWRSLDPGPIDY
jgi:DNA-3-methyladenine glycosylase II